MSVHHDPPTFVFQDEKVYAINQGKVIASGDDVEEVERIVEASAACECGKETCDCGGKLSSKSTHIVTPNGLKGQILGRHRDVWGDQVTVRFENGRIASFAVTADVEGVTEEEAVGNPVEELKAKLDAEFGRDETGLVARAKDLKNIRQQASNLITAGVSDADRQTLHELAVTADYETSEIEDALEHLQAAEPFTPDAPFETQVVEQAGIGGDASWIDGVAEQMITENEGRDFEQIMDEGPELFVADLEDPALADAGTVHSMASNYIRSRTAGIEADSKQAYETTFLARVEQCRKLALASRKESVRKQAASEQESNDGDAESLFL